MTTPSIILDRLAHRIINRGWCQKVMFHSDGRCCVMGHFMNLQHEGGDEDVEAVLAAERAMADEVAGDRDGINRTDLITRANDARGQTSNGILEWIQRAKARV